MKPTLAIIVIVLAVAQPVVAVAQPADAAEQVTLTISLVDENGDSIGNAELTASWDGGTTTRTTASNGKAFVDVPKGADVTIEVDHDDYVRNRPIEVEDATESGLEITAYKKATATVTVLDGGSPVTDATVRFKKNGHVAAKNQTDADGVVESGVIEAGDYTVTVNEPGYLRAAVDVHVADDTKREIAVEQDSVTIDFTVRDDHFDTPQPVEGATIAVDGVGTVKTLDNGEAAMKLPVNTKFDVSVEKPGYESASGSIDVGESGDRMNFTIQRTPNISVSTVSGRVVAGEKVRLEVTDEYGAPVAGASVSVDGETAGTTDDTGVILVQIDEAGEHTIAATKNSLESAEVPVEAIAGDNSTTETTTQTTTEPEPTESSGVTSLGQPGFGLISVLVGLVAGLLGLLLFRRHR